MRFCLLAILPLSLLSSGLGNFQDTPAPRADRTRTFMRAKLVASQHVLDGLVSENFQLIAEGSTRMKQMSEAVGWPQADDPVYEYLSETFRKHCDQLTEHANAGNLPAAHLTYLQMTSSCIECHNYVRGRFRVAPDQQNPQGPVRLIPTEWGN